MFRKLQEKREPPPTPACDAERMQRCREATNSLLGMMKDNSDGTPVVYGTPAIAKQFKELVVTASEECTGIGCVISRTARQHGFPKTLGNVHFESIVRVLISPQSATTSLPEFIGQKSTSSSVPEVIGEPSDAPEIPDIIG